MADTDDRQAKRKLERVTHELVEKINDRTARWAELYTLMAEVESEALWKAGGFRSMTKWLEDLARIAKCNIQYLWRVKKAGGFYARYAAAEAAAGREAVPVAELTLGDEMLADIDRVADGDEAKAREYIGAALDGTLTKAKVKDMVRATAGARRKSREAKKAAAAGEAPAPAGGEDGATAGDIVLALTPELFYGEDVGARHLLHGARRVWRVFSEFPVRTGTSDRARRMDALCMSNAGDDDQYDLMLDMVEIKVTFDDLDRDTKHLEYENFADRCWFAVPESMSHAADAARPDGWGVLVWSPVSKRLRVEVKADVKRGIMRHETLATVLVKTLPAVKQG